MKWQWILLVVGVILMIVGISQYSQFEENGVAVTAVITEVKTSCFTDEGTDRYTHTYYGEYILDGKTISDVKVDSERGLNEKPSKRVGDTVSVTVDSAEPEGAMSNGVFVIIVGLALVVWSVIRLWKSRNASKTTT